MTASRPELPASSPADNRIGVLYFTSSPFIGGACYGVRSIIRQLDKQRFRPLLAVPESSAQIVSFFEEAGIQVVIIRSERLSRRSLTVPIDFLQAVRQLAKIIRQHRVQIFHSTAPRAALVGPLLRMVTGVKFVYQLNMLGESRYLHLLARLANRAPCVSRAVYEEYGARPHMQVIYNGPWTERLSLEQIRERRQRLRAELGISEQTLVVGSVSNFVYWKGNHVLIQAFAKIARQIEDVVVVHVGGTAPGYEQYQCEMEALIESLGIGSRYIRLGFQPDGYRYYPLFDVFVHVPVVEGRYRHTEAFGHSVAEAMAYALPVITSRLGGPAEIVQEGVSGELIEPGDSEQLATKILELLADRQRREKMGRAGYDRYQRCFTIEQEVRQYEELYESLLAASQHREKGKWTASLTG